MTSRSLDVLLIEPYAAGSHAAWAEGYQRHSRHAVRTVALPGRFWKWRMHGAAVTLAASVARTKRPDVVLASDMLDLATFLGLTRRDLADTPAIAYFHENQLTYPAAAIEASWPPSRRRRAARRDDHYAFINLTTALAADRVVWNSAYNRDAFLGALPAFLRRFPDQRVSGADAAIGARSHVVPVGLDLEALCAARPNARTPGPPRVLWNHRWEHDKNPDAFADALLVLAARGADFRLNLIGEAFAQAPPAFARLHAALGDRIEAARFVVDRTAYGECLWQSDVCVSTAHHEFFGVAVCEAAYCGNHPVLPRRLAYPEIFPPSAFPQVFYDDAPGLVEALASAIGAAAAGDAPDPAIAARVGDFAWPRVAADLDALVDDVVASARDRGI